MSSPPHICNTETRVMGTRDTWHVGGSHLNVTTAWSVVLLPSSQPLGRMPGEPQLISEKRQQLHKQSLVLSSLNLCPLSLSMFKLWLQFQQNVGQINERKSRKLVWWFISSLFKSKVIKFFLNYDSLLELNPNHSTSISRGYWEILDKQKQIYNQPSQKDSLAFQ